MCSMEAPLVFPVQNAPDTVIFRGANGGGVYALPHRRLLEDTDEADVDVDSDITTRSPRGLERAREGVARWRIRFMASILASSGAPDVAVRSSRERAHNITAIVSAPVNRHSIGDQRKQIFVQLNNSTEGS